MLTLGLHFGHDANMALVDIAGDTIRIVDFVEKERTSRVRHALGLSGAEIAAFLERNGLPNIAAVSAVHVTSTQGVPIIDFDGRMQIAALGRTAIPLRTDTAASFLGNIGARHHYIKHLQWFEGSAGTAYFFDERAIPFSADHFLAASPWQGIADIRHVGDRRQDHRQDILFTLDGVAARRACFVSHHLAHANYAARSAPFRTAVVVTFDGLSSIGFDGGGVYLYLPTNAGQVLLPVVPHGFWCGTFYDRIGTHLGFEADGAAGKLMGLSSYGLPAYDDVRLLGPMCEQGLDRQFLSGVTIADRWLRAAVGERNLAWDTWGRPPALQADIAASAQRIYERNVLALVSHAMAMAKGMNLDCEGVVLSGGCALNCPANSLVARHVPVYVPPAVNDEGLGLGAASIEAQSGFCDAGTSRSAYLGRQHGADTIDFGVLVAAGYESVVDPGLNMTARLLADGGIGALFHGRSEVGPRALGHRSILASPLLAGNLHRVNGAKNREPWRPLAPMATRKATEQFFSHVPDWSYFMLFTGRCLSSALPATTHVDGSARVQIVDADCGPVFDLLSRFGELTGHEVLLNTSFNGRGEPIAETPADAARALLAMGLDFLWIEGRLLRRSN